MINPPSTDTKKLITPPEAAPAASLSSVTTSSSSSTLDQEVASLSLSPSRFFARNKKTVPKLKIRFIIIVIGGAGSTGME